ncbi:MAG: ATP synthase F0 subunit B [Pseudomonadota bacterium]
MTVIPNISTLFQLLNFLFTLLFLNFILLRPIRRIVAERKERIARSEAEIERLRVGAQEKLDSHHAQLEQARVDGAEKRLAARKVAQDEERGLLEQVGKEMEAMLQRARAEIAADAQKARTALRSQAEVFASAVAEKILGRSVS